MLALYKWVCASALLLIVSFNASAFDCQTAAGVTVPPSGGTANVYVTLTPQVQVGQNLVVDLSTQILCRNFTPTTYTDMVALASGTTFSGALNSFAGSAGYNGSTYSLPLTSATPYWILTSNTYTGWPAKLYLTPISTASGVAISAGALIASLTLRQTNQVDLPHGIYTDFIWNIYANNNVIIPTGGCDVSSRNLTINLPDYPGTASIPLTVYCASNRSLAYYLTGPTANSANNIFTNTSSSSPAQRVGIQISNGSGPISTNSNVSLGTVGTSSVSLGLTASYAQTGGQVIAGNVQSVVGVTFVYP